MNRARARLAAVACLIAVPAACGGSAPAPAAAGKPVDSCPAPEIEVAASGTSNPDASGEGRPVQVRLYQLKSDASLKSATFDEIWQDDGKILQDDLLKREEHTVYPGKTEVLSLKSVPGTKTLGIVALFREAEGQAWFVTYELAQSEPCPKRRIRVELDGGHILDATKPGD